LVVALLGCSRPAPIVADPATTSLPDAAPAPAPEPPKAHYFMDTSGDDKDCYRDVSCKPTTRECSEEKESGNYDDTWTNKFRAAHPGDWCCYSRTICEFPSDR
jgi:hypothetical protein